MASTWFADRRLPAGGTFDAGTGIGAAVFVDCPDDAPAERAGEAAPPAGGALRLAWLAARLAWVALAWLAVRLAWLAARLAWLALAWLAT
jgi:hypothetical protein